MGIAMLPFLAVLNKFGSGSGRITFAEAAAVVLVFCTPFVMGIILYRVSESGKLPPAK